MTHFDEEAYEECLKRKKLKEKDNTYSKTKICNYCEEFYSSEELSKKLTLKMIIQMDKHLSHRANQILERNPESRRNESDFDWLNRAESRWGLDF